MNTRQSRADADTAATLRAIPESMRTPEIRLWLDDYDNRHAKRVPIRVTKTEPFVPPVERRTAPTRPIPLQQASALPQSSYVGSGWRMNFKTMTLERTR